MRPKQLISILVGKLIILLLLIFDTQNVSPALEQA